MDRSLLECLDVLRGPTNTSLGPLSGSAYNQILTSIDVMVTIMRQPRGR